MSWQAWIIFAAFWVVFVTIPGPNVVICIHNGIAFCVRSGSFLFWHAHSDNTISFAPGASEAATGITLEKHIFVADKGDHCDISDQLPQFAIPFLSPANAVASRSHLPVPFGDLHPIKSACRGIPACIRNLRLTCRENLKNKTILRRIQDE